MAEFVTSQTVGGIATIRIARAPVNALNMQSLRELAVAAAAATAEPTVAAVVVYGGEKVFAAGDDVAELAELSRAQAEAMVADRQAALGCLSGVGVPTVAAISGYALGGGLELALGADRRIVGDNVKLGLPQVHTGLIPGSGMRLLSALVGPSRAKDLVFTGRFVSADEALAMGLVDEVVAPDDVYNAARRWAEQFVGGPAAALAAAKAVLDAAVNADESEGLATERRRFVELFETADHKIGTNSYLADGPGSARFTGRSAG